MRSSSEALLALMCLVDLDAEVFVAIGVDLKRKEVNQRKDRTPSTRGNVRPTTLMLHTV